MGVKGQLEGTDGREGSPGTRPRALLLSSVNRGRGGRAGGR